MEQHLPKLHNNQLTTTPPQHSLNERERAIARLLVHVNQLSPFPLSASQIADWAKSIEELQPDMELDKLKQLIDKMKMGRVEYDHRQGIQNIFRGYRSQYGPREVCY